MDSFKTTGIILNELDVGESNKRLVILAKDYGKIAAFARGAKKSSSKLLSAASPFCLCNFIFYKGNNFISITQVELIDSFYNLRNNFEALCYGAFFLELVEKTSFANNNCDDILILLIKTLSYLNKTQKNVKLVSFVFILRLLKSLGFMPEMSLCVNCESLIGDIYFFNSQLGGLLCEKCSKSSDNTIPVSKGLVLAFNYVLKSEYNNMFSFTVTDSILNELYTITLKYLNTHIDVKLNTLNYISSAFPTD